jgi:hypothetical protein
MVHSDHFSRESQQSLGVSWIGGALEGPSISLLTMGNSTALAWASGAAETCPGVQLCGCLPFLHSRRAQQRLLSLAAVPTVVTISFVTNLEI